MRRKDREVNGLDNILAILDQCDIIRLGMCADNKPYIVPMNFAYEVISEKIYIYFHCASEGKKLDMIAKNNNVCFEAHCSYRLLESEKASGWSAEFQSVMGEGIISVLTETEQKINILDIFMHRHGFVGKPEYGPEVLAAVTILKVVVSSITGKRNMK